ncbi:hypothetical protein [Psychrobacter sp. DAB_AL43B]|uniref:hypothetical protein n=1 Tax=Psychrobacter sp. DAB_AL43B TaxID=1028416 RepID=UPI0009A8570B|nr:hypothetical protein [Psychrobacter sp. DAB_AL43B]SLJ83697.1 hypothetical protein DABAL43B_0483 [Psychrobacter sp. DAB_AL43B]
MNKLIMTPIALSLLAFALTGCGEGEDAIFGSGSGNNELTISTIERSSNAIARIDTTYRTGARDVKKTNIIGSYNQNLDDLDVSVVLSDKFEGTLEDKNIEVNGRIVKRPIYEKNSNNQFNYETNYKTLNLSGKSANSYRRGDRNNKSTGVLTDLNNYTAIPSNATFPSGSVCYVPVASTDRSFFSFSQNKRTGYLTLDKWTEAAEKQFGDNRASKTTLLNIGAGNNQQASQVEFFATNNEPSYLYNGVEYNKVIYNADFVGKNQSPPNQNDVTGVIDCTIVNDIAADFLADQIKRYY